MTYTPPIPAGNQPPYPLREPPHEHASEAPPVMIEDDDASLTDRLGDLPLTAIGAVVGLSVALVGGVLLGLRRGRPNRRGRKAWDL